jgi:hypothetical protein
MGAKQHFLLVFLLWSATLAHAAKTQISIECKPDERDMVGSQVCTALRDAIETSPRYSATYNNPNGYRLKIITIGNDDQQTAISMVLLLHDYYFTSWIQLCGSKAIETCARSLLSSFDDEITSIQRDEAKNAKR